MADEALLIQYASEAENMKNRKKIKVLAAVIVVILAFGIGG